MSSKMYKDNVYVLDEALDKILEDSLDIVFKDVVPLYALMTEKQKQHQYYLNDRENRIKKSLDQINKKKEEDPLRFKFNAMISSSKVNDKKYNRLYNKDEYINIDFLLDLHKTQNKCCYCECNFTYGFNLRKKVHSQITIERKDNLIAHTKLNCRFSCFRCNIILRKGTFLPPTNN